MSTRFFLMAGLLAFGGAAMLAQGRPTTVLDGVYSDAQAERGKTAYGTYCVGCHEGFDNDGPKLTGDPFLDRWREDRLDVLFGFMKTNMPGNRPGGLSEGTYADVLAFLLKGNGFPAGAEELSASRIPSIQLVGRDGPQPLPSLTVVRVVGCLEAGAADAWSLVRAGDPAPVRTRNVDGTTPEELAISAARPLGTLTFPLRSLTPDAAASKGHKVQVKGVPIRQYNAERINVMSLDSLAAECGP